MKGVKSKVIVMALLFYGVLSAETKWPSFYDKAPEIRVKDPMAALVGSLHPDSNIIEIGLKDVAQYTGHVCAGVLSAYLATYLALEKLYPDRIPQRGDIKVASFNDDFLDVASYITGARGSYGRGEINENDIYLDPSLREKGRVIMIFKRKDNGKAVKVIFYPARVIPMKLKKKVHDEYVPRFLQNRATKEDILKMGGEIQKLVKKILSSNWRAYFEVVEEKNYKFPEK